MPQPVTTAQNGTGAGSASSIAAPATNHTGGNCLAVGVRANSSSAAVISVTDTAGNQYYFAPGSLIQAQSQMLTWFYAKNITGNAANVVTATYNGSFTFLGIVVLEYSGLSTNKPFDRASTGQAGPSATSVSAATFTPSQTNDITVMLACSGAAGGNTWTPSAGYTNQVLTSNSNVRAADNQATPSGAQTPSISYGLSGTMLISTMSLSSTNVTSPTMNSFATPFLTGLYVSSLGATNFPVKFPPFFQSVAVSGVPVWPNFTFGEGVVGVAYSQDFDLYPALSPTTYTVVSGAVPTGLSLSNVASDIGRISGTPTVAGTYNFTLRATNSLGTADKAFTLIVAAASGGGASAYIV